MKKMRFLSFSRNEREEELYTSMSEECGSSRIEEKNHDCRLLSDAYVRSLFVYFTKLNVIFFSLVVYWWIAYRRY